MRYLKIKQMLKEKIETPPPDAKLGGRPNLRRELDTIRTTLDKAMAGLVCEGLLYFAKGSGTCVAGVRSGVEAAVKEKLENQGIIVPNVMDRIYYSLIRGVENEAQKDDVNIILCNSDGKAGKQEQYIKRLTASKVTDFVIVPAIARGIQENYELYSQLLEAKVPFVFYNRSVEGISTPMVAFDDYYGVHIATGHLIAGGYRHITLVARGKYKTSIDYRQSYLSAPIENGLEVGWKLISIEEREKGELCGYNTMKRPLVEQPRLDAILCFNDRIAQGVCQAVKEAGGRASDDINIISYDDTELCVEVEPKLSTVSHKSIEIGEKTARTLRKAISQEPLSNFEFYLLQPNIVERDSRLGKEREPTEINRKDEIGNEE